MKLLRVVKRKRALYLYSAPTTPRPLPQNGFVMMAEEGQGGDSPTSPETSLSGVSFATRISTVDNISLCVWKWLPKDSVQLSYLMMWPVQIRNSVPFTSLML